MDSRKNNPTWLNFLSSISVNIFLRTAKLSISNDISKIIFFLWNQTSKATNILQKVSINTLSYL
jgi:hypothetical protein